MHFLNRRSGRMTYLQHRQRNGVHRIQLMDEHDQTRLGRIKFEFLPRSRELEIHSLKVAGHSNMATATNPTPGAGRLLMYLACEAGLAQGALRVELSAVTSALGFYARMGMHRPSPATPPLDLDWHAVDGRLDEEWLSAFDSTVVHTRGWPIGKRYCVGHAVHRRRCEGAMAAAVGKPSAISPISPIAMLNG